MLVSVGVNKSLYLPPRDYGLKFFLQLARPDRERFRLVEAAERAEHPAQKGEVEREIYKLLALFKPVAHQPQASRGLLVITPHECYFRDAPLQKPPSVQLVLASVRLERKRYRLVETVE